MTFEEWWKSWGPEGYTSDRKKCALAGWNGALAAVYNQLAGMPIRDDTILGLDEAREILLNLRVP